MSVVVNVGIRAGLQVLSLRLGLHAGELWMWSSKVGTDYHNLVMIRFW